MSREPVRSVTAVRPIAVTPARYDVQRCGGTCSRRSCLGAHDRIVMVAPERIDRSRGYLLTLECGHQQGSPTRRKTMPCWHCPSKRP